MLPGQPLPLGATWTGEGVNFAVYSEGADSMELCLFDTADSTAAESISLPERTGFVWHGFLPDAKPGQLYGFPAHGPYDPADDRSWEHIPDAYGRVEDISAALIAREQSPAAAQARPATFGQ